MFLFKNNEEFTISKMHSFILIKWFMCIFDQRIYTYKLAICISTIDDSHSMFECFYKRIDASIFIGQVKHLEFDLIRNQSH